MRTSTAFLISGAIASLLAIALAGPCLPEAPGETLPCHLHSLLIAVVSFGLAWSTLHVRHALLRLAVAGVTLGEVYLLSWVFAAYGIEWPPYPTMIGGALATLLSLLYHTTPAGLWRGQSSTLFLHRASPETLERIHRAAPVKPGESREGSTLVLALPQRRELAATLPPEAYRKVIETMQHLAATEVRNAGGIVEETGEGWLRAFFGVVTGADPTEAAYQSSRAALLLADRLEQTFLEEKYPFALGIASGTGIATVTEGSFLFSGYPSAEAERLAEANTLYGTWILLCPETARLAEGKIETRPADQLLERDGSRREIYELLGLAGQLSPEETTRRDAFWKGLVHFRRGETTLAAEAWREADPEWEDPLVSHYRRKLESSTGPK